MTEIQKFYDGQSIFITGGTGYLGKVLVEKLLRSCPGVKTIYILTRPKKGKTIQERMHEITNLPMFEPLRAINPNFEKKLVPLPGDIMDSGLGLSLSNLELIKKEVSIVFHTAATTRFDESLKIAHKMNVESVQILIDICKECKNLKAIVYVSTAFSNCIYEHIEEKVYPAPLSHEELSEVVQILERQNFSEKEEETFTNLIIGKFPNTYCFTKAIAEELIGKSAKELPVSVYRFSIALSSLKEPVPGWLDTAQGISQTLIRIGKGIVRVLNANGSYNMETVPIDLACNCLIASGWETATKKKTSQENLQVYNFVSSRDNPITWSGFQKFLRDNVANIAFENMIYCPDTIIVKNMKLFFVLHYIFHFIPAILGDIISRIMGKRPRFYTIFKRGTKLATAIRFFVTEKWLFDTENVKSLWNKLSDNDKKIFNFDITSFTWNEMLLVYIKGGKKYYLHEDESPEARKRATAKYWRLFYIHQVVRAVFYASVLWLVWKIFIYLFYLFN